MVDRIPEAMKRQEITKHQRLQYEADAESRQRGIEREEALRRVREGEEPWRLELGAQSVVDALRDAKFPAEREELMDCFGDRIVRLGGDFDAPLKEVLRRVGGGRFLSLSHLETVVLKNWDAVKSIDRENPDRYKREQSP